MVVVRLEQTFFNVSEDAGVVEICARVYEPADPNCPIEFPFDVRLATRNNTAGTYERHVHAYPLLTEGSCMFIISIISVS